MSPAIEASWFPCPVKPKDEPSRLRIPASHLNFGTDAEVGLTRFEVLVDPAEVHVQIGERNQDDAVETFACVVRTRKSAAS